MARARQINRIAISHGDELQGLAERIASQFGANVTPINFKSIDSIIRKAADVGFDGITDAVRTTIVSNKNQLQAIVKQLKKSGATIKEQMPEKYSGYHGFISKVKFADGTMGEIQANTPKMIFAKEKPDVAKGIIGEEAHAKIARETGLEGGRGHELYEKIRVLDKLKDAKKLSKLNKESKEYYSHFYD